MATHDEYCRTLDDIETLHRKVERARARLESARQELARKESESAAMFRELWDIHVAPSWRGVK